MEPTWEVIVKPSQPIPLSDLEIRVAQGEPFDLAEQHSDVYARVLRYWDQKQVQQTLARADDLAQALQERDEGKIARMQKQIGSMELKHRLSRAHLQGSTLTLALSTTTYMDFIGTNERAITDPEWREQLMNLGIQDRADQNSYFASPLAVCAVMYCFDLPAGSDSPGVYVPIALRSNKVMIYPGVHHVFGGMIDVGEQRSHVNLNGNIRRELREEMGIPDDKMGNGFFYGIIRQKPGRIPEAICGLPVYVSQEELERSWRTTAPGKFEHRQLTFHGVNDLPHFLETYGETMVPSGAAALTSFMEHYEQSRRGQLRLVDRVVA